MCKPPPTRTQTHAPAAPSTYFHSNLTLQKESYPRLWAHVMIITSRCWEDSLFATKSKSLTGVISVVPQSLRNTPARWHLLCRLGHFLTASFNYEWCSCNQPSIIINKQMNLELIKLTLQNLVFPQSQWFQLKSRLAEAASYIYFYYSIIITRASVLQQFCPVVGCGIM